jgi:cytochrome c peroxidase
MALLALLAGMGCDQPAPTPSSAAPAATTLNIDEPLQPLPLHLELDERKIVLGERLFADPKLSGDGTLACLTCHPLERGGADNRPRSKAMSGLTAVNTPTVFNVGFSFRYNWNGAFDTLEKALDAPFKNAMGTTVAKVVEKVGARADYRDAFRKIYADGVTETNVRDVFATYERSLYTPNARFDRWLRGDETVLTADEKDGYALFKSYGCASCHQGANVGGNMFQKLGVMTDYFAERGGETKADQGRYNSTSVDKDRHVFRVPSLRNVARTAPYFHDGSAETLEQAIRVMARYQLGRPLEEAQVGHIAAFLRTLTGEYRGRPL